MATKNVNKTRLLMKHDIEANWLKAENFIPLEGEIVVYDADETHSRPRMKIGDGETQVGALPFATVPIDVDELEGSIVKTINGVGPDENGDVTFYQVEEIVIYDNSCYPGGQVLCYTHTASDLVNAFRNTTKVYPLIKRKIAAMSGDYTPSVYLESFNIVSVNDGYALSLHFDDKYADIIVNSAENTITLDPNWVAPTPVEDQIAAAIEGLATESYVETAVANLVDSSPDALNTLNELAAALGDDPNFATTVTNQIAEKADKAFVINVEDNDGVFSADKTFDEIKAAYDSGKEVICKYTYNTQSSSETFLVPYVNSSVNVFTFEAFHDPITAIAFNNNNYICIRIFNTGEIRIWYKKYIDSTGKLPNPNFLKINKNGTAYLYNGSTTTEIDINIPTIPTTLPNPNKLTIKQGQNEWEYSGSQAIDIELPEPTTSLPWESITNKPFGEDIPIEGLFLFDSYNPMAAITTPFVLTEGTTYKITAGDPATVGFEATYTAEVGEYSGSPYVGLGNHPLVTETGDNGEKYSIINFPSGLNLGLDTPVYGIVTVIDEELADLVKGQNVYIKIDGGLKTIEPKYLGEVPANKVEKLIYEETIEGNGSLIYELTENPSLVVGKEYQVTIQGKTFAATAIANATSDELEWPIALVETAYIGSEDGASFAIALQNNGVTALFLAQNANFDTHSTIELKIEELSVSSHLTLVTDENGNTKWVERTHYEDEYVEYFPEGQLPLTPDGQLFTGGGTFPINMFSWLEFNKPYTITYNGINYNCEYINYNNYILAGNAKRLDDSFDLSNGEPFAIIAQRHDEAGTISFMFVAFDQTESTTITLKISNEETRVKKLDKKFMPDGLFYMEGSASEVVVKEASIVFDTISATEANFHETLLVPLEEGKQYIVTINGINYEIECKKHFIETLQKTITYLGNLTALDMNIEDAIDTGEFFCLFTTNEGYPRINGVFEIGVLPSYENCTIAIKSVENYSKLPSYHIDFSDIEATDDEILEAMASLDMLPVVTDESGAILTDENSNILLM